MDNIIEFPRMKKSEELTDKLVTALIAHCHKEGMNTVNPDFVFDMAWVHKFLQEVLGWREIDRQEGRGDGFRGKGCRHHLGDWELSL